MKAGYLITETKLPQPDSIYLILHRAVKCWEPVFFFFFFAEMIWNGFALVIHEPPLSVCEGCSEITHSIITHSVPLWYFLSTYSALQSNLQDVFFFFRFSRWANDQRNVGLAECFPPTCDSVLCAPFFMQPPSRETGGGGGVVAGIIEKGTEQRKGTVSICSPLVSSGRRERGQRGRR